MGFSGDPVQENPVHKIFGGFMWLSSFLPLFLHEMQDVWGAAPMSRMSGHWRGRDLEAIKW
jgi:hypothetical protein